MGRKFIIGIFSDEHKLVKAAAQLKKMSVDIHDIYTPFPLHGLDNSLNIKGTNLPWVTFIAGGIGLIISMAFQVWSSAIDWPLNVGGKPLLSIPAFIPVAFEITVLLGALTTVAAFLFRAKLFPGKEIVLQDYGQTDDKFIIAIERTNASFAEAQFSETLRDLGATEIKLID